MIARHGRSRRGLAGPVGSLSSQPMVTLGVDLASQAKRTAVCLIRWDGESADVDCLRTDVTDSDLLELFGRPGQGPDKIAIDAPFGWPEDFVRAIHAYSTSTGWPSVVAGDGEAIDWSGGGRFVETYPAAALRTWGLPSKGYKGPGPQKRKKRAKIVAGLAKEAGSWLTRTEEVEVWLPGFRRHARCPRSSPGCSSGGSRLLRTDR